MKERTSQRRRDCFYNDDAWNILVVDDDEDVIKVTEFALSDYAFEGKGLRFFPARSELDTIDILKNNDIAVAFIDIIMEREDSGLRIVKMLREELNNFKTRVIIRTGQPSIYPESEVAIKYEINDYKTKDELTDERLACSITTALRSYCDLMLLEHYAMQERLYYQQSKMAAVGEMIGAIAHQWQQPLSVLTLMLDNLKDSYLHHSLNEFEFDEYFRDFQRQLKYMKQTIRDFQNFLKPSKEKMPFSIKESISSVLELLSSSLKNAHIKTIFHHLDDDFVISGYENEIKQVFLNIIKNSIDAVNAKKSNVESKIIIHLEKREGGFRILFEDSGDGIPQELLPSKIFDPYISTKGEKGTGIGLSICKSIIENGMGGKISATNGESGARIEIWLPTE